MKIVLEAVAKLKFLNNSNKVLTNTDKNDILYVQEVLMTRKLTLSLDSNVIEFAHDFSRKYDKPISKIVEDYFLELRKQNTTDLPKDLEELYGIFEGVDTPDKYELRKIWHEKHNN
jgi:hypothetical protein